MVWRFFPTLSEGETLALHKLKVSIGVVQIASWSLDLIFCELTPFPVADRILPLRELTTVGVECNGTLRVVILESFGFRKSETYLRGRTIC